jgi:serine/threonine protein kinase/TolB-like protein
MTLSPGSRLGPYEILAPLGAGGMGEVYRARDSKLRRDVAIKVLPQSLAADADALARFEREALAVAALSHPNILAIFDFGTHEGTTYAVMELLEGETLRGKLDAGPITQKKAVDYALQVAKGLSAAHEKGIVHRDLKPENLFVSRDGHLKILDFGLAKREAPVAPGEETSAPTGSGHTEPGTVMGTAGYMSPEQVKGFPVDHRSDIFSFGTILYELLSGKKAFKRDTNAETMAAILRDEPPELSESGRNISPALDHIVKHCLEKDRDHRFQSVRDIAFNLSEQSSPTVTSGAREIASPHDRYQTSRDVFNELKELRAETSLASSAPSPRPEAAAGARAAWRRAAWVAASAAILLGVALYLAILSGVRHSASGAPGTGNEPHVIRSIAVLPLDNYSGDANQEFFAEGMTDELTADLATISQLRVISRGSAMQFKGTHRPPTPEIARKLNVDAIVEGSVLRAGDKVRITAQLIDARSDRHLWAKSFERSSRDVLALQDELASAIAREIHVQLTPAEQSRLTRAQSVNPEAYDAYLKGRYYFNRPSDENLKNAIARFEEAIALNPNFAPAHSGLSDAYLWAGYNEGFLTASEARPKAKAAAEKAIQLDDQSAEAHTSLAVFKLFYEYDWAGCEREFRRAFALNPNYAFAYDQFGLGLAFQGRLDEAIAEGRRAAELDPLSPQVPLDATVALAWQGQYQAAKEQIRRAADLDPIFFFSPWEDGWIDIQAGTVKDAIPQFQKAKAMESPAFVSAWLAYAYGASGDRARALAELEELKKVSLRGSVTPFNLALVFLGSGDHARAVSYLEQAYASDTQWLGWLKNDRIFDPLRSEPRFVALMRKLRLDK